jgi:hypothetical protein
VESKGNEDAECHVSFLVVELMECHSCMASRIEDGEFKSVYMA